MERYLTYACPIYSNLYLGGERSATSLDFLQAEGITHILSVSEIEPQFEDHFTYLHVPFDDSENVNLLQYLDVTLNFITASLAQPENKILVHCQKGVSRSASVVTAYIMAKEKICPEDALEIVLRKRNIICPNDGFMEQLHIFHKMKWKVNRFSVDYLKIYIKR